MWRVVKKVYEAFPGLPTRLAENSDQSPQWWQSHGRPPESDFNPTGTGKDNPTLKKMDELVEFYESVMSGAGVRLLLEMYLDARCRYQNECEIDQRKLVNSMVKESNEAAICTNAKDFDRMTNSELERARKESVEAAESHTRAAEAIDKVLKRRNEELSRSEIKDKYFKVA